MGNVRGGKTTGRDLFWWTKKTGGDLYGWKQDGRGFVRVGTGREGICTGRKKTRGDLYGWEQDGMVFVRVTTTFQTYF